MRFVYAIIIIAIDGAWYRMFCTMLNFSPPMLRFTSRVKALVDILTSVAEESMIKAAQEAIEENPSDIKY